MPTWILERGSEEFRASSELWTETLLLAGKFGWRPSVPSINFLAENVSVSDGDAKGLFEALNDLFNLALKDPLKIYPIRVDMGELYLLKEFLGGGSFSVRGE